MASNQGNYDSAANVPLWVASSVNKAPTAVNASALYENVTADAYFTGATVGVFGVDQNEAGVNGHVVPGWVLRTVGSGGRAGRTTEETLSVVSVFRTDNNSDDAQYPDTSVVITTQPSSRQYMYSNSTFSNTVSFTVAVDAKPNNANVTYLWQYNSADGATGWTTIRNGSGLSLSNTVVTGNTTATLTVAANTIYSCNTTVFRAVITATPPADITNATATSVNSANGQTIVFTGV